MVIDLIKKYSKTHTEKDDYYFVSHRDSETHALQNRHLERHEVSTLEDRVPCQICFKYQRPGETGAEEVKEQAGQRINSRFVVYVLGIHNLALKKKRGRRYGNSAESQKTRESK